MTKPLIRSILFLFLLVIFLVMWSLWIISSHRVGSIVSWDEGFHGGSALYISQVIRNGFELDGLGYIRDDFINGIIWYPPLWLVVAGVIGAIVDPSIEVYRFATLLFAVGSILIISLFTKSIGGSRAGLIAAVALAFTPVFIVYSHLMMREVPLLFAVSTALLSFYRYLTKKNLTSIDLLMTFLAFLIGVLGKIVGIVIIFGVIASLGLLIFFKFKQSLAWERLKQRWIVYFLVISLASFFLYRLLIQTYIGPDMLLFHMDQTKQLSGSNIFLPVLLIKTLFTAASYYTYDFLQMPILSLFFLISLFGYMFLKRSLLSFFLLIWVVITYLVFSSVRPQATQYILSIYVPLSIAAGLFWGQIFQRGNIYLGYILFILLLTGVGWSGYLNQSKTASWIWRDLITNQNEAVNFVVTNSQRGDRVFSTGDGTRLMLRLAGFDKKIQTINGAAFYCAAAMQDSTEWAIVDHGPQNPMPPPDLSDSRWQKEASFKNVSGTIDIYKNTKSQADLLLNSQTADCARFFKLGRYKISIIGNPTLARETCPTDKDFVIRINQNRKAVVELNISQYDLASQSGTIQTYEVLLDQKVVNGYTNLVFDKPANLVFDLKSVEIEQVLEY